VLPAEEGKQRERGDKDGTAAGGREKIETPGRKETEEKDE
jgi:hypothetical protein